MTLWHGRFSGQMDQAMANYTVSLPFDRALATEDLLGSAAHVEGLVHVGLLTQDEGTSLLEALETVAEELASNSFLFDPSDEDIHTEQSSTPGEAGMIRWQPTFVCGPNESSENSSKTF